MIVLLIYPISAAYSEKKRAVRLHGDYINKCLIYNQWQRFVYVHYPNAFYSDLALFFFFFYHKLRLKSIIADFLE